MCVWVCLYMWVEVLAEPEGAAGCSGAIVSHPVWCGVGHWPGSSKEQVCYPNHSAIFPGPVFLSQDFSLFWLTFICLLIRNDQEFTLFCPPPPIRLGTKASKVKDCETVRLTASVPHTLTGQVNLWTPSVSSWGSKTGSIYTIHEWNEKENSGRSGNYERAKREMLSAGITCDGFLQSGYLVGARTVR